MIKKLSTRIILFALIGVAIGLFYFEGYDQYLGLANLHNEATRFLTIYAKHPIEFGSCFLLTYIAITGLSLPLATAMTLAAGFIFGVTWGCVIVTFAAAIGATVAFWTARYFLQGFVERKFASQVEIVNQNVSRNGAQYLFFLRMVPAFPFFVVNLIMGLTNMRTRTYFYISFLGMIPGNILYVNAGSQLVHAREFNDLLSPWIIASLIAAGAFPFFAKQLFNFRQRHKQQPTNRH